jgi:hypothetical protein
MPSPGEDIQSWSVIASDNGSADPLINWVEGQTRASVNNSSRSEMAAHAKDRNLRNGSIVTTGTANAQAFVSGVSYTAVPSGLVVKLKVGTGLTNTASMTLNMDGIGAVLVKTSNGDNLLGGEFIANDYVDLLYDGTNWIFLYGQGFIDDQLHGGGGVILGKQIFSTPGGFTYYPTPGMECGICEVVAGGGGGGGASAGASEFMAGGGGGGGGYARKYFTAADIGGAVGGAVGAGGTGSVGGGTGGTGGTSNLHTLCSATGGQGGFDATLGNIPQGGAGGSGTVGDCLADGGAGGSGFYHVGLTTNIYARPGSGGNSVLGGGGQGCTANNGGGSAGGRYGGGAGGSASYNGAGLAGGSSGASGVVIITEFAGRGAPGRDGETGAQGPIGPPGPAGAGTGDVLVSGTPAAGQLAQWTDTSHIQGVSAASVIGSTAITNVVVQTFTASGTYTPNGMKFCIIECIGGGAGGGFASAGPNDFFTGGGGGSGGYSRSRCTAAQIGASKPVTIGAGGPGGNPGGNGGVTSVGSLCIANGGFGGDTGYSGAIPGGGDGAIPGTGDIAAAGAPGNSGFYSSGAALTTAVYVRAGEGGSSIFGGGGKAAAVQGNGNNGRAYGAGGSGGSGYAGVSGTGGNGSSGVVIITEYI